MLPTPVPLPFHTQVAALPDPQVSSLFSVVAASVTDMSLQSAGGYVTMQTSPENHGLIGWGPAADHPASALGIEQHSTRLLNDCLDQERQAGKGSPEG
jgi:hypothetical protein